MKRITVCKVFVHDQDQALDFYTRKLGFEVAEDNEVDDYRWLLVCLPDNKEFCLNLDLARNEEQEVLVGRQAADATLFSIETDDCIGDYTGDEVAWSGVSRANPWHNPTGPGCSQGTSTATGST